MWSVLVPADHNRGDVLVSWTVAHRVPRIVGAGRRVRIMSDLTDAPWWPAGHPQSEPGSGSAGCGPHDGDAGHACGPHVERVLAGAEVDVWAQARQRVRRRLDRARALKAQLDEDSELTVAALAEREGIAPARISEALSLLRLPGGILAELEDAEGRGPVPTVLDLEKLARVRDPFKQAAAYQKLCRNVGAGGDGRRAGMPKQRGFQHLLARARRYREWLDTGAHRSLSSIARAEGITHYGIAHVLDLLSLAPDILAAIDVPPHRAPGGVTQGDLRRLVRLKDQTTQIEEFRRLSHHASGCAAGSKNGHDHRVLTTP